jgi:transposase InsO family protein
MTCFRQVANRLILIDLGSNQLRLVRRDDTIDRRLRKPVLMPDFAGRIAYRNHIWCYDFVEDGRRYRMLNVLDELTHECLAIRIARKLRAIDVIDVLSDLFILRGIPGHIRSDNGPEFVAEAVQHPPFRSKPTIHLSIYLSFTADVIVRMLVSQARLAVLAN